MRKPGKKTISVLLVCSCILSGVILASAPVYMVHKINTNEELDTLLKLQFEDSEIAPAQIRTFTINVDSNFTRKVYRIKVPPSFSKTTFHHELNKKLYSYGFETPARVFFPNKDMNIYVVYEGSVIRTLRLISEIPSLPETSETN